MKLNQRVLYLSCEFDITAIDSLKGTATLRNSATMLKKPPMTVETRFIRTDGISK